MTTYRIARAVTLPITPFLSVSHLVPSATYLAVTLVEISTVHRWTLKVVFIIPYTVLASHQQKLGLLSFLKVFPTWDKKYFELLQTTIKTSMNRCLPWVETSNKWTLGHMNVLCSHTLHFELAIKPFSQL